MKICNKCNKAKQLTEFSKDKGKKDGLCTICKECKKSYHKKWYASNAGDEFNKQRREKYAVLPEEEKEIRRAKKREWYQNNKDKKSKQQATYLKTEHGRYLYIKRTAAQRNIEFNLTKEEFSEFWQTPCHYCNDPIETVGLDRIDSSVGYIVENVVSCCSVCNYIKLDHETGFLKEHLEKMLSRKDKW